MGGHGGPSGLISKAKQSKIKAEADAVSLKLAKGEINLGEAMKQKKAIAVKYDIDGKTLTAIQFGNYGEQAAQVKKAVDGNKQAKAASSSTTDASSLPGNGSNPWPPDASDNHMSWSSSKDIWDQMGGGYNNGGVGGQQAKDMFKAVQDFTDGYYGSIRKAQASGDTTSSAGKKAQQLESFISHGVKAGHEWSGGTTYRGIQLSSKVFDTIKNTPVGQQVDPNIGGVASWSTRRSKSESFAGGGYAGHSVVFVTSGSTHKNAVSIKNLSYYSSENEVLASGSNTYTKVGQFEKNGYLYVYVDVN